jgi:hypothetical protein
MTDEKIKTKNKAKKSSKKTRKPVTRTVRKELRLDNFTKGLLEKLVGADAKKGKSSTESSIIREAIHKYYVEKKNEPE